MQMAEKDVNKDEKLWALFFTHLSALVTLIGIPLGPFLGFWLFGSLRERRFPGGPVRTRGTEFSDIDNDLRMGHGGFDVYHHWNSLVLCVDRGRPDFCLIASIRTNEGREFHYPLAMPFFKNE